MLRNASTITWRVITGRFFAALLFTLTSSQPAWPITMAGPDDRSLADTQSFPLIVIARWDGKPFTEHHRIEKGIVKETEIHADIVVERSIKGHLEPGSHTILVTGAVGWTKEEPRVCSYATCFQEGDADADKSSLWFLYPARSCHSKDKNIYPELGFFRAVQPLELEPYFVAIRGTDLEKQLSQLLSSRSELVIERTLQDLCGDALPWPYRLDGMSWRHGKSEEVSERGIAAAKSYADMVKQVIETGPTLKARRLAAAVYALGAGHDAIPTMRRLLGSADPALNGIAIGTLAALDDVKSAEAMAKAVIPRQRGSVACEVIDRLAAWNRTDAVVPILINYLQTDQDANDFRYSPEVPAVLAHEALRGMTARGAGELDAGINFPFDVTRSREAWEKAAKLTDESARRAKLRELLPEQDEPLALSARYAADFQVVFIVKNRGIHRLTVVRDPRFSATSQGLSAWSDWRHDEKIEFITLAAGESFEIPSPSNPIDGLLATFSFDRLPNDPRLEGWVGSVAMRLESRD